MKLSTSTRLILLLLVIGFIYGTTKSTLFTSVFRKQLCPKCNVVIISIDPVRADNLPCFGYRNTTTPNLCRFANRNIIFTSAYAQSSWTLPSIMSMITSQYPYQHGMLIPHQSVLSPSVVTLPQALKSAGYVTSYIGDTENSHLPLDRGLGRGFDSVHTYTHDESQIPKILDTFTPKKPFFLFIHNFDMSASWNRATDPPKQFTFDPTFVPPLIYDSRNFMSVTWKHAMHFLEQKLKLSDEYKRTLLLLKNAKSTQEAYTYFKQLSLDDQKTIQAFSLFEFIDLKNPQHVRLLRNLYDERLSTLDKSLTSILDTFTKPPWSENTIIIVVSNHGDELGEHGKMSHGTNLFASTTHIPLIMRIPDMLPKRISTLVSNIDLYPTLMAILGLTPPPTVKGENLLPLILGSTNQLTRNYSVAQLAPAPWISTIRTPTWSYYQENDGEIHTALYDLTQDPDEQTNSITRNASTAEMLKSLLNKINSLQSTSSIDLTQIQP